MQIELFPNPDAPCERSVALRTGRVGPIRFAATRTSFTHLHQVLAILTAGVDRPIPGGDLPGEQPSAPPLD